MVNGCEQSCDHNSETADRTKPVNCENLSDVNNLKSSLTVEVEHVVNEEKTCCDLKERLHSNESGECGVSETEHYANKEIRTEKLNRHWSKLDRTETRGIHSVSKYQTGHTVLPVSDNEHDDHEMCITKEEGELTESETSSPIPQPYKKLPYEDRIHFWCTCNVFAFRRTSLPISEDVLKDHDIKKCSVKDETLTADSDGDDLIFVGEIRGEDVIHEVETEATKYVEKELIPNSSGDQDIEIVDIIRHNDENYCVEKNPNINENKYSNVIDGKDLVITISNKNAVSQRGRKYTDNKSDKRKEHNGTRSSQRNAEESILCIRNLVRPFTLAQLKHLLQKTGTIVHDKLWLDSRKLRCYVQYQTTNQAVETKRVLNGLRWPAGNPKKLDVRYVTENDLLKAQVKMNIIEVSRKIGPPSAEANGDEQRNRKHNEEENLLKLRVGIREWDIGKPKHPDEMLLKEDRVDEYSVRNKRPRKDTTTHVINEVPEKKKSCKIEERHIKTLDELFKRTTTVPNVYWLPLTDEQVVQKHIRTF